MSYEKICEKVNQKLSAFARISKLTTPTQRKKLMNSYQCTVYLLSFDIDAFFKGNTIKELKKYSRGHSD